MIFFAVRRKKNTQKEIHELVIENSDFTKEHLLFVILWVFFLSIVSINYLRQIMKLSYVLFLCSFDKEIFNFLNDNHINLIYQLLNKFWLKLEK